MPIRDTWHRTLVYFGLAEDEGYEDDDYGAPLDPEPVVEDSYRERPNVRRLSSSRRRPDDFDDIFANDAPSERRPTAALRPVGRGAGRNGGDVRVHFVAPRSFNDVQDVADKFKQSIPAIINLQGTDP